MALLLKSLTLLTLLIIVGKTVGEVEKNKQPKIWLSGYEAVDSYRRLHADSEFRFRDLYHNLFVSKKGNDFVINPQTFTVEFTCEAEYPIAWEFPFPEQIHSPTYSNVQSRDFRVSELNTTTPEPVNIRFKIVTRIFCITLKFLSANFTCRSLESNPELHSSIYIFLKGKSVIEHSWKTLNVFVEDPTKLVEPIVLPCRPASPDLKVVLEKQIASNTNRHSALQRTWKPLNLTDKHITFDPKIGFTLQRSLFALVGKHILSLYRCRVTENGDNDNDTSQTVRNGEVVYVNVTVISNKNGNSHKKNDLNSPLKFEPRSIIHGNASVRLDYTNKTQFPESVQITCCSGNNAKPPKLYSVGCRSRLQCEMLKETILGDISLESGYKFEKYHESFKINDANNSSDCSNHRLYDISVAVVCKGESIDFVEHFVQLFHPLVDGPVVNRSNRISQASPQNKYGLHPLGHRMFTSLTEFETSGIVETATVSQKMALTIVGNILSTKQSYRIQHSSLIFLQDIPLYDDECCDELIKDRILKSPATFLEYDRDVYYEGEPMVFMCFGTKLFHSSGSWLRLNWENGNTTVIETMLIRKSSMAIGQPSYIRVKFSGDSDMFHGYISGTDVPFIVTKSVMAKAGMKSVDCWMPQIDSSRWDKMSKSLLILPAVAPKFQEPVEETVYFYLGDEGNTLFCTVSEGLPFPDVMVTRDGVELEMNATMTLNGTNEDLPQNGTCTTEMKLDKDKQLISITVNFSMITRDHQAVFLCTAKNVNGTVTRSIKVLVIEKRGIILPASFFIVGIFCLVLIGLAVKYLLDKRKVRSDRENNKT